MISKAIVGTNARKETKSVFIAITDIRAAHGALVFGIHLKFVASDTDIARRIWHLNLVLFELVVNGEVKLTGELAFSLDQRCGPRT